MGSVNFLTKGSCFLMMQFFWDTLYTNFPSINQEDINFKGKICMQFSEFFLDLFRKRIIVEKIFSRAPLYPFTRKIKNQTKGEEMTRVTMTPRKWQNSIWNMAWFCTLPYIFYKKQERITFHRCSTFICFGNRSFDLLDF